MVIYHSARSPVRCEHVSPMVAAGHDGPPRRRGAAGRHVLVALRHTQLRPLIRSVTIRDGTLSICSMIVAVRRVSCSCAFLTPVAANDQRSLGPFETLFEGSG